MPSLRSAALPGFAGPVSPFVLGAAMALAGCGSGDAGAGGAPERVATTSAAVTSTDVASLALANVGGSACGKNSLGGSSFDSSCTGNGGQPEYWCADFARWVWANAGASNTSELTAAAGSFYVYGQKHGTLSNTPAVGDAVVFDYKGGGVADHVALVTKVNANGTIETVSGDWDGQSGSEAYFSSTSHVVLNTPAYAATVGSSPSVMGMTISGYIAPVGVAVAAYAAQYVSQSFPLASTALTMTAGQTLKESITLSNGGDKAWDGSTRLGTTQPRDRASAFADPSWVAANRLAQVSGSVAPGGSYKFEFVFHAPNRPGTYYEYFNLVQEGVAWFSDPGQGGPPDDDIEAQIVVLPGKAPYSPTTGIKRHVTDPTSFASWKFDDFEIAPTSAADVAAYPDGAAMPATPEAVVAPSSPAVWVIDGNVRRHVVDPASLDAWKLAPAMWTAAQVAAYAQGADWPASPYLVQASGDPAVYVLDVVPLALPGGNGAPDAGAAGSPDGGAPGAAGGSGGSQPPAGGAAGGDDAGAWDGASDGSSGGCAVSGAPDDARWPAAWVALGAVALAARARGRRRATR